MLSREEQSVAMLHGGQQGNIEKLQGELSTKYNTRFNEQALLFWKMIPLKLSLLSSLRPKSAMASPPHLAHTFPDFIQISSLSTELLPNALRPFFSHRVLTEYFEPITSHLAAMRHDGLTSICKIAAQSATRPPCPAAQAPATALLPITLVVQVEQSVWCVCLDDNYWTEWPLI